MAERYQHHRFIGGDLLQTRRDQNVFAKKAAPQLPRATLPVDAAPKTDIREMD